MRPLVGRQVRHRRGALSPRPVSFSSTREDRGKELFQGSMAVLVGGAVGALTRWKLSQTEEPSSPVAPLPSSWTPPAPPAENIGIRMMERDDETHARQERSRPLVSITIINITGCVLLGLLHAHKARLHPRHHVALGTGFCGALTVRSYGILVGCLLGGVGFVISIVRLC